MSFTKSKTTRITLLLIGLVIGFLFGTVVLGGLWFVITGIVLGYGDSGPAWFNTVTHILSAIGIIAGLIIAHYIYVHYSNR